MSWPTWTLFMTAVFLLSATPGPNMLHVMSRSVSLGLRRSLPAMAGCLSGILVLLLAAAAGLVALLRTFPVLFELLRYAGAAYLLWLGIKCWRHAGAGSDGGNGAEAPRLSTAQLFRGGFWVSISNPKSLLFVGAFLPQFIDPARPQLLQWGILIATFAACELFGMPPTASAATACAAGCNARCCAATSTASPD